MAEADLALSQAWLDRRLAGLTPEDFEGELCIFCTSRLEPPPAFADVWCSVGEDWDPNGAEPILQDEEATSLHSIFVFCNQTKQVEVDLLVGIVGSIDALGIDAPPLYWVPHSAAPEYHREGCRDYVPNDVVNDLFQRGVDGIVHGEPEGMGLALALRSHIHKSASLSQSLQDMVQDFRERGEKARYLQSCMQRTLWDYVRVRMAPEIPPMNRDIPDGEIQVPGYDIGNKLGQGSFGAVYQLFEVPDAGNPVQVVKVVSKQHISTVEDVKYLNRMIYVMKRLSDPQVFHPNLIKLYDTVHTSSHIMFRSEFGGPENLYCRLADRDRDQGDRWRPLQLDRVASILNQTVAVVAYLHTKAQICHRDIKPENMIVNETQDSIVIKLADFDVAVIIEGEHSIVRSVCGTFPFVAPEVILEGQYDCCAADVWSLGVVLLEILCGLRVVQHVTDGSVPEGGTRADRARAILNYFETRGSAGALLQERCRPELREVQAVFPPLLNGMLDPDPCGRIESDEVRTIMTSGLRAVLPALFSASPVEPGAAGRSLPVR